MCHRGELKLRQQGAGAFVGGGFYREGSAKFRFPSLRAAPAGQRRPDRPVVDQVEGKSSMPERIQMYRHPRTERYAAMDLGAGLRTRAHTADADLKPAALTRRVFLLALAGSESCC